MKILCITTNPASTVASTRYRISQYVPRLQEAGHEVVLSSFYGETMPRGGRAERLARGIASRSREMWRAADFDVVFVHREIMPFAWNHLVRLLPQDVPLVFDFDDAVFLAGAGSRRPTLPATTRLLVDRAALVFAGNEFLASYARRSHDRVIILPTVVDTEQYRPRATAHADIPLVGWIGSPTTAPYLDPLLPVLDALGERLRFRLRIVGANRPITLRNVEVECPRWSADTEAAMFRDLDVGLYPLPNDLWVLGKCGFKAIQYMASGVASIVSPFGVVRDIVRDGVDGLWAHRPEAYGAALSALLESPDLRADMGRDARARAVEHYSLDATAPVFAEGLQRAASRTIGEWRRTDEAPRPHAAATTR